MALVFLLPPSAQSLRPEHREGLRGLVAPHLPEAPEVHVAPSYDVLTTAMLSGEATLAWAPPMVAARLEAAGAPIIVRAVRQQGASTYRGALVCRADKPVSLEALREAATKPRPGSGVQARPFKAVWVDRESAGGYLLVANWLREQGLDPDKIFAEQKFLGSYQAALGAVLAGVADVCSAFGPPPPGVGIQVEEFVPGRAKEFKVLGFTSEAPNDGIAVGPLMKAPQRTALEKAFLDAHLDPKSALLISAVFRAQRFELASPGSYRALYRTARPAR